MDGTCKNCGADAGLHHYETSQCPVGGVEASIGRMQEWQMYQRFEPVPDDKFPGLTVFEIAKLDLRDGDVLVVKLAGSGRGARIEMFERIKAMFASVLPKGVKTLIFFADDVELQIINGIEERAA